MASAPGPTVTPYAGFDKDADTVALRKAMKGLGTDEKAIIDVLAARSSAQRQELILQFKTAYGRDLISDLKSELSGHFEDAILALMSPPELYDAKCLKKAMKGLGTDESAIIEVLCTRNNKQIHMIRDRYKKEFKHDLEKDLKDETSGNFKRILIGISQGGRDEGPADASRAAADAQTLYKAGEGKLGTDESEFQRILVAKSAAHLRMVFDEYEKVSKKSIEKAIKSEMSRDLENAYLTIVGFFRNPVEFYADLLQKAMVGVGTDEDRLIRIIVSRSEWDLELIKSTYMHKYKRTLVDAVKSEVSGDFRKLLIALIK
ncbi:annexin A11-like [Amphiura filiformis]|uniref:annexin A11-like n=1 Tax=Amphiura filiformis TaxID=82378 RepID=UPI003B22341B